MGLLWASKKGATVISRVSGIYMKKGATFRRAFLPIKKGATIILTLNADG
jgi:hypothetical protein